jgi:hypothetical protein
MKSLAIFLLTILLSTSFALAEDAAPSLPLSKAAKLAEDAIAEAKLPADCYVRSIALVRKEDAPAYYRATYKLVTLPSPAKFDIIRITMDGKVSFEQENSPLPRVRVQKRVRKIPQG